MRLVTLFSSARGHAGVAESRRAPKVTWLFPLNLFYSENLTSLDGSAQKDAFRQLNDGIRSRLPEDFTDKEGTAFNFPTCFD